MIDAEPLIKKYVSIRVLWTDIMASTINYFRGTTHENTFCIYRDALSQLTCTATKAWLKTKLHAGCTWFDIWITPELELNKEAAYAGRPVGNSPEMMPLDCSLLADLGHDLSRHVRVTKEPGVGRPAEVFPLNTTAADLFSDAPPVANLRRRGAGVRRQWVGVHRLAALWRT